MKKMYWSLCCLSLTLFLVACSTSAPPSAKSTTGYALNQIVAHPTPTPTSVALTILKQQATPTPAPQTSSSTQSSAGCLTYSNDTTKVPAKDGSLDAPYGAAPVSSEAQQLASDLFQLINSDRAACGLPAFSWNATLASGALLHSWNMVHCGFSHTCPDGSTPYQRIANEGFAGLSDCGENIGEAGPYPTPLAGVTTIQESMAHEAADGWHRIHLFSTTLHSIGIGVYVDSGGNIWFTEDMVS